MLRVADSAGSTPAPRASARLQGRMPLGPLAGDSRTRRRTARSARATSCTTGSSSQTNFRREIRCPHASFPELSSATQRDQHDQHERDRTTDRRSYPSGPADAPTGAGGSASMAASSPTNSRTRGPPGPNSMLTGAFGRDRRLGHPMPFDVGAVRAAQVDQHPRRVDRAAARRGASSHRCRGADRTTPRTRDGVRTGSDGRQRTPDAGRGGSRRRGR